jgi:hypothetical protein
MFGGIMIRRVLSMLALAIVFLSQSKSINITRRARKQVETMEMPDSSPRQFNTFMPPTTNFPSSQQIGVVPPGSSMFELSYDGDRQAPMPFHNAVTPFEMPNYFYHWQMPHVEYITDIQPNDGTYT